MKQVTVAERPITVNSGQVQLTAAQAKTRLHNLKLVKAGKESGVYEVVQPIQFKAGETFGFDGVMRKDGILHDPQAEARERLSAEQQLAEAQAAAVAQAVGAAREQAVEDVLASLKPETAALVRAELDALARADDGRKGGGLFAFLNKK